jgi:hypothetical protein
MIMARVTKIFLLAILSGAPILTDVHHAMANVLRWNLQSVTFNDGGTASGFFDVDTIPMSHLTDFDIKMTGGKYPSFEYNPQNSNGFFGSGPFGAPSVSFGTPKSAPPLPAFVDVRQLSLYTSELTKSGTYPLRSLNNFQDITLEQYPIFGPQGDSLPERWLRTGSITTEIPTPASHGTLVRWTLNGVRFDNGRTASGSFLYDASSGSVEDFNLHSDEAVLGDINQLYPCRPASFSGVPRCWVVSVSRNTGSGEITFFNGGPTPGGSVHLTLVAGHPLTDNGGTVPLLDSGGFDFGGLPGGHSKLIAGSLIGTPVPEPSAALLIVVGIGALAVSWRTASRSWRISSFSKRFPRTVPAGSAICSGAARDFNTHREHAGRGS